MLEQCDDASVWSVKNRNQDVGDANYSVYPCKAKRTQFVITLIHLFHFSELALEMMLYLKLISGERGLIPEPLLLVFPCIWILLCK